MYMFLCLFSEWMSAIISTVSDLNLYLLETCNDTMQGFFLQFWEGVLGPFRLGNLA